MTVGVLAFQGDFAEHIAVLHSLRVPAVEVRSLIDLAKVDYLIIPGGESTVIAKFLSDTGIGKELTNRINTKAKHPIAVYGTCAGAIVLARRATGKHAPKPLKLIDIAIERNAYGTQVDSFESKISVTGIASPLLASFIRAPKITWIGKGVEVLARNGKDPVLVRQGRVLVGTFHTEVHGENGIHKLFLKMMLR